MCEMACGVQCGGTQGQDQACSGGGTCEMAQGGAMAVVGAVVRGRGMHRTDGTRAGAAG